MKKVEIKLKRSAIAPLLDFMKPLANELGRELAVEPHLPEDVDSELAEAWRRDLLESLGNDVAAVLDLFGRRFFEEGTIEISPGNAESVLRAAAAIRLRLRERFLKNFSDEALENGRIDHGKMSWDEQRGYASYLFLATIQEVVIEHLDEIERDDA